MTTTAHPLYLGIDTGGTFTDGVLLDPQTRHITQKVKILTSHQDLKTCISQVLDRLVPDDPASIVFVSLSTTLATNAIAEGKRQPAALLLMGYDPDLVYQFEFQKQFGTDVYFFVQGRHSLMASSRSRSTRRTSAGLPRWSKAAWTPWQSRLTQGR
jgi:N-methylhydantoinase A/oxoprolinase/acetone carboxylase beta subunit